MLGYTSRYQLLVYSCNSCLIYSFMLLCSYPSVICLSCYLVIFWMQFILLLSCAHCLYARAFPFTHTLTRSLSDDPRFARPDIGRFVSKCRCTMRLYASRRAGASPYLIPVFLSFLPSYYFLILVISDSVVIPVFIYMISCVDAYMWYYSNHDLSQFQFITCFGLL